MPASENLKKMYYRNMPKVRRIIEEVDPLTRGIECAVLLRQNKDAAELAAYLQSSGIAVALEGKSNPCIDNPFGSAARRALQSPIPAIPSLPPSHAAYPAPLHGD